MQTEKGIILWPNPRPKKFEEIQALIDKNDWKRSKVELEGLRDSEKDGINLVYIENNLGIIYTELGLHNLAIESLRNSLEKYYLINSSEKLRVRGSIEFNISLMYYKESGWDMAHHYVDLAINDFQVSNLGDYLEQGYNLKQNIEAGRTLSVKILDNLPQSNDPNEQIEKLREISRIYANAGAFVEALTKLQEADAVCENNGLNAIRSIIINDQALLFQQSGSYEKSQNLFEKALDLALRYKDEKNESIIRNNYGVMLREKGDSNGSIQMLNAALGIKKKIGLMHTVGSTYYNLAKAYLQNDELSKALENAKQALENDKKHNQDSIEDDISLINEIQAAK